MNKTKIAETIALIALFATIVYCGYTDIYWFNHPDLSQMQVLINTFIWFQPVAVLVIIAVGLNGFNSLSDSGRKNIWNAFKNIFRH